MDDNKRNLLYFEAESMRKLYNKIDSWQEEHRKRFQSVSVQQDGSLFCCIATTNPSEVVIVDGNRDAIRNEARVSALGYLRVQS